MKNISILGSTGSIGTQTLDVVRFHPNRFKIISLSANNNIELLESQIREFKPLAVSVTNEEKADILSKRVDIPVYKGSDCLIKVSTFDDTHILVNSVVGSIGLTPTIEAIKKGKTIALANKETLVAAGSIIMNLAKKHNTKIIPIDSEHSALFQCINGEKRNHVSKLILTCSGGPFRGKNIEELKNVTVKDALAHPNWSMGSKISIDSSTLMNKGLEVIEAHWLCDIPYEQIDVVIHPQSIIHSLVEFHDKNILAHLGNPDMRLPIQYALSYPERFHSNLESFDFIKNNNLTFEQPDKNAFPCLQYAFDAGLINGTMPAVMNKANEVAVSFFLRNKCTFLNIADTIKYVMENHNPLENPDLNDIFDAESFAEKIANKFLEENNG